MSGPEGRGESSHHVVALQPIAEGVVIPVRAHPAARRNALTGVREGRLCVSVTAPADKGKANKAVEKLVAKSLGVAPSRVEVIAGAANRQKRLLVRGADAATIAEALRGLIDPAEE